MYVDLSRLLPPRPSLQELTSGNAIRTSLTFLGPSQGLADTEFRNWVGEGLVSRPHLLGESAQGIYYLTSGKLKGRRNRLRIMMNEKRKVEDGAKVKEVRENAQLMHARR